MVSREHIEHYLIQTAYPFESIEEDMWLIQNTANIVITYNPPLIIFRAKLMEIPERERENFFKLLLELNASQMIHGAYGIEGENVVVIDTLEVENLNFNEFQASLDAISVAISQDYQRLKSFRD